MMEKLKILFVSTFVPGPNTNHAGGRDVFHIMRRLAENHQISIICLANSPEEISRNAASLEFCRHVELIQSPNGFLSTLRRVSNYFRLPRSVARFYSVELHQTLHRLLERSRFDVIQYENVQVLPYAENIQIPGVLDCIDVNFMPMFQSYLSGRGSFWRRLYWLLEWPRLQIYEARKIREFKGIIVRSKKDEILVRAINSSARVAVVQSLPLTASMAADPARPRPRKRPVIPKVMFMGAMWRPINSDACLYFLEQIWPKVRQVLPEAEFWIVGDSPPSNITKYHEKDNIVVTGYVDDMLPYFKECSVVVVPMLAAGGILYKIYDAMHIGIPVISTSVANQGIDAIHGQHILLADNAQDFAEHVVDLLRDDHLYARLSENSERFINEKFDWERSVRDVEDLYSYLAQK